MLLADELAYEPHADDRWQRPLREMTSFVNGRGGGQSVSSKAFQILTDGFSPTVNQSARQMARRTDPIRAVQPIARR